MEKIYSESKKNKSAFKKIISSSFSVKCSFLLAIVTMASILYTPFVSNRNSVSYALPDEGLPTKINSSADYVAQSKNYNFPVYVIKENKLIYYCIEEKRAYNGLNSEGKVATNSYNLDSSKKLDSGLAYLLGNLYPKVGGQKYSDNEDYNDAANYWVAQMAVWLYQYETSDDATRAKLFDSNVIGSDFATKLSNETKVRVAKTTDSVDIINNGVEVSVGDAYTKIIRPMVDSAKKYSDSSLTLTVGIDDEKVTLDADKKYLKTSFLSVVGSPDNQYLSYSIEIPNIPKDTVLIDADGNEIKNESEDAAVFKANNLQKGTKFYLKVPVASITESNKKISVKFIGQFDHYVARAFTANNLQSLVGLEKENLAVNNSKDLLINYTAKSEDTALDVSSSTYIIAFLIIVIGVGSIGYVTKKTI